MKENGLYWFLDFRYLDDIRKALKVLEKDVLCNQVVELSKKAVLWYKILNRVLKWVVYFLDAEECKNFGMYWLWGTQVIKWKYKLQVLIHKMFSWLHLGFKGAKPSFALLMLHLLKIIQPWAQIKFIFSLRTWAWGVMSLLSSWTAWRAHKFSKVEKL